MPVFREVRRRRRRRLRPSFILFCLLAVLLLAGLALLLSRCAAGRAARRESAAESTAPAGCVAADGDIHTGPLILVSNDHDYTFPDNVEMVVTLERCSGAYLVRDYSVLQEKEAFAAFDALLTDFAAATGLEDVNITSAYRSYEEQEELFSESGALNGTGHAERYVSHPGGSEHHTGLAVDLNVYDVNTGVCYDFDGQGEYRWINDHCADYGVILRYTAEKEPVTGIAEESWHFRYVGRPHAAYMAENGLCLEEYIDALRAFTVDSPLHYGGYTVYFCPQDALYVPKSGGYSVSGNNVDGFIVTAE